MKTQGNDRRKVGNRNERKRGVVAVQVAVMASMLLGFAALSVDVGAVYNAKAELQRTADSAALAATARLSEYTNGPPLDLAKATAVNYAQQNTILGAPVTLDANTDVTFGRAVYDTGLNQFNFVQDNALPDAIKIQVRLADDSPNGSLALYFARVFGIDSVSMSASAIAVLTPRDMSIVADLSGSHNDDSELRNYAVTDINLFEVWDALPGGIDDVGGGSWDINEIPGGWITADGSAPQAAGPGWGFMQQMGWGTSNIDGAYNPSSDDGLVRLPYNGNWSDAQLETYIADRGYTPGEVNAIMSRDFDSNGAYKYRVAVAMGLAFWNSGQPGGLWEQRGVPAGQTGNGNNWIGGGELEWTESILGDSTNASASIWLNYIDSYVRRTSNRMYQANSNFRYQFGAKTFTNYLLERRYLNSQTADLAATPIQPMQAVKDAVNFMVGQTNGLDADDQLSLEIYGTTARHEVDLTHNHQLVSGRLDEMQAGHYDAWTNMGGGLQRAIQELSSGRARAKSHKMIILLTDGNANVNSSGQANDYPGGAAWALTQAQIAADLGMSIFAVSVGAGSNQSLMQQIADIGRGEHFHAEGSIDQYSQQLAEIFAQLASKRPVELIQ